MQKSRNQLEIERLQREMSVPGFWYIKSHQDRINKLIQEDTLLQNKASASEMMYPSMQKLNTATKQKQGQNNFKSSTSSLSTAESFNPSAHQNQPSSSNSVRIGRRPLNIRIPIIDDAFEAVRLNPLNKQIFDEEANNPIPQFEHQAFILPDGSTVERGTQWRRQV